MLLLLLLLLLTASSCQLYESVPSTLIVVVQLLSWHSPHTETSPLCFGFKRVLAISPYTVADIYGHPTVLCCRLVRVTALVSAAGCWLRFRACALVMCACCSNGFNVCATDIRAAAGERQEAVQKLLVVLGLILHADSIIIRHACQQ